MAGSHHAAEVDPIFQALRAAAPARVNAWMANNTAKIAERIYTSWRVPIERQGENTAIFRGPLRLYRLLDSFERDTLADAYADTPEALFTGGSYNTEQERVGGAAFGVLPLDVLNFERKGSRLKPPLYLVEIEGNGLPFVHLMLGQHARGDFMYALGGSTGLGVNVRPRVRSVLRAWSVDSRTRAVQPLDWLALLAAHRTGKTAEVLRSMRVYENGWRYFDALINAARRAERDDEWNGAKRFWSPSRKDEARRELQVWADAITTIEPVLPGMTGLNTYDNNIIKRLPTDLQRAFTRELAQRRKRRPSSEE